MMLSEVFHKFLRLPGSKAIFTVRGGRVNRGAGYGLEIPVHANLFGHAKAVVWAQAKIDKLIKEHEQRLNRNK